MTIQAKKILVFSIIALCLIMLVVFLLLLDVFKKQTKVVTTNFPIYDVCRELLGNDLEVSFLQDSGVDMHNYTPSSKDVVSISKAELFLYIGGESDDWVEETLATINNSELTAINLMETVIVPNDRAIAEDDYFSSENCASFSNHEHHESDEEEYDEHIWLSINNMQLITSTIKTELINIFPNKEATINNNFNEYIAKLNTLQNDYLVINNENTNSTKNNTIIVADRFPFAYLFKDYNLYFHTAFVGCSAESEASFSNFTFLVDKVNSLNTNYIIHLETSKGTIANTIKNNANNSSNIQIITLDSIQSINQIMAKNTSYIQIMQNNLNTLKTALSIGE